MNSSFYIVNANATYFLNLCGHYTITENVHNASAWDDPDHKEMWFYVHELRASTNQDWYVVDNHNNRIAESKKARTFECALTDTIENVVKFITVESETFNERFNGKKFIPTRIWQTRLLLKGTAKYILIAETKDGYFRYKNSIRDLKDTSEKMWLW